MQQLILKYFLRILVLVALLTVIRQMPGYEKYFGQSYDIIYSILRFLLFFITVNLITAMLVMIYRIRKKLAYKYTDNVISGINNLYYLIVTIGVILMILGFWGIDVGKLLTSLSIAAAAVAIISKEFVSAIISGIIISFTNDIGIDDYVKIGGNKGKILDISLTKVTMLNEDDDIIFIPNDKVYLSEIINYTKREIRKINIDFEIDLSVFSSVEKLEMLLKKSLEDYKQLIEPNSISLNIVDIHREHLTLKFQFKLKEVNRDVEKLIRKQTARMIVNAIGK
jgi:small-conductance mechanosensitive channel